MWWFQIPKDESWDVNTSVGATSTDDNVDARTRANSARSSSAADREHELMNSHLCKRSEWLHAWNVRRAAVCMEPLSLVWRGGWRPGSVLLDDACTVTVEPTNRYNIDGASLVVKRDGRTLVFRAAPDGADLTTWWATIARARERAGEEARLLRRRSSRRRPVADDFETASIAPGLRHARSAPAAAQHAAADAWGDDVFLRRRSSEKRGRSFHAGVAPPRAAPRDGLEAWLRKVL
jgi:hypothetical protein